MSLTAMFITYTASMLAMLVLYWILARGVKSPAELFRSVNRFVQAIPRPGPEDRWKTLNACGRDLRPGARGVLRFTRRIYFRLVLIARPRLIAAETQIWTRTVGGRHRVGQLMILGRRRTLRAFEVLTASDPGAPPRTAGAGVYRWTAVALIVQVVIISAVIIWLSPNGLLQDRLGPEQDLSFMFMMPALGISVLFLLSALASLWWRNRIGRVARNLLFGAALAVLVWSAIALLPNIYVLLAIFGKVNFDPQVYERLVDTRPVYLQAGLLVIGLTVLLSAGTAISSGSSTHRSLAAAAAWVYSGSIIWWGMYVLGERIPIVAGIGIVVFAASAAQSLTVMAIHGVTANNVLIAGISRWSAQSRIRALNVGILVGIYAAFLRPLIFDALNYPLLWEWLLGASIVLGLALLTGGQINRLRHAAEQEQRWQEWRRHELKVEAAPHQAMEMLAESQRAFVDNGVKADLLVYGIRFLNDNRLPPDRIIQMVTPIVNYFESPIPRLALWGVRRRHRLANQAVRTTLLRDWIAAISDLTPQLSTGRTVQESPRQISRLEPRQEAPAV